MFQTSEEVIKWLEGFGYSQGVRTLDHMKRVLEELENPHLQLKTIHVAGTNGKGSTVAFLRDVLMAAGYKVGTFTSPHITAFGERMSINGEPMASADLIRYANQLSVALEASSDLRLLATFDVITLLSFLYFKDVANLDVVLYEAGIGGRLDSTNVISPIATAITNIGHDHAEILGATKLERAREKVGIVKPGVPLFTTEVDPILLAEFKSICGQKGAPFHQPLDQATLLEMNGDGVTFKWGAYEKVQLTMHGEHQFKNAVLALSVVDDLHNKGHLKVDESAILEGFTATRWQGRFEHIQHDPPVVLDGAHNLEGMAALIQTLINVYPNRKKKFIFSALQTKDAKEMMAMMGEVATHVMFTKGSHPQGQAGKVLHDGYKGASSFDENHQQAIEGCMSTLAKGDVLVICGSLYFISDARAHLLEK